MLLERTHLWTLQAVPSTVHGLLTFPTDEGIAIVHSTTFGPPERSHAVQPNPAVPIFEERSSSVDMEDVLINKMHNDQKVKVGMELPLSLREILINLLKKHVYALAWKTKDMTRIPRTLIEHRLNINLTYVHVKKKKRIIANERNDVVNEEV